MSGVVNDSGRSKRQLLKKQIALLKDERSAMSIKIEALETRLMDKCPHHYDSLREGTFVSSGGFGSATPPLRVCIDCGYAEEGWGCGYWKLSTSWELNDAIPKLTRDEAFKFVRRFWTQDMMDMVRFSKKK